MHLNQVAESLRGKNVNLEDINTQSYQLGLFGLLSRPSVDHMSAQFIK